VSGLIDPIDLYERKRADVKRRLAETFIVFVNAPDPATDNQGYFLCGSYQDPERDEFTNFDSYTVGRTESDIRDIRETLDFWDAEERGEHSPDGKDYHAIVAAKALAAYQRDILRDSLLPLALAAETVFFDTLSEIIVLHADGEMERFDLNRQPGISFLAGDDDADFRRSVLRIVGAHRIETVMTEEQATRALNDIARAHPGIRVQLFALGPLCPEPTAATDD
jgi:hypothetical protein